MITNSRYGKVYLSLLRGCLALMLILTAYYSQLALAQSDAHVAKLTASQRQWISQQGPIEFAVESDYGPFIFLDHEGEVKGLSVDVLQLIGRKTGLNFVPGPPSHLAEILKQAQANQTHHLAPGHSGTFCLSEFQYRLCQHTGRAGFAAGVWQSFTTRSGWQTRCGGTRLCGRTICARYLS